jgi:hypothetical protein
MTDKRNKRTGQNQADRAGYEGASPGDEPSYQVRDTASAIYGRCRVESDWYQVLSRKIVMAVEEGLVANVEVEGAHYRRSRVSEPCTETCYFSLIAVFIDSNSARPPPGTFRDGYHRHPYGELSLLIPLDIGAALAMP